MPHDPCDNHDGAFDVSRVVLKHQELMEAIRQEILEVANAPRLGAKELGRLNSIVRDAQRLMMSVSDPKFDVSALVPGGEIQPMYQGSFSSGLAPASGAPMTETYGTAVMQELMTLLTKGKGKGKAKTTNVSNLIDSYTQAKEAGLDEIAERLLKQIDKATEPELEAVNPEIVAPKGEV